MRHDDIILDMVKKTVEDKKIYPDNFDLAYIHLFFLTQANRFNNAINDLAFDVMKVSAISLGAVLIRFLEEIENYQEGKDGITRVG
jgi:hypothetical protein